LNDEERQRRPSQQQLLTREGTLEREGSTGSRKIPEASTLVSAIKLSSLLYFAAAASLILMGIEFSDGNLYVKVIDQQLLFTVIFFMTALVLIFHSAVVLNSVNRKLTMCSRVYLNIGNIFIFVVSCGILILTI
jgi:hypothetical protein